MSNLEQHTVDPADRSAAASNPIGSPRDFALACLGLLSLLADEVPALLERSVQRGSLVLERAQTEAKRRRAPQSIAAPPIDEELQQELLRRGLPTHSDFEKILQQVAELEQQIERLAAQRAAKL